MANDPRKGPTPSDAAIKRLHSGLQDGIASYTSDVVADVEVMARAVADAREDQALEVVRDHLERLGVFAGEMRRVVAGAAAEREAEGVLPALPPGLPSDPGELPPA